MATVGNVTVRMHAFEMYLHGDAEIKVSDIYKAAMKEFRRLFMRDIHNKLARNHNRAIFAKNGLKRIN